MEKRDIDVAGKYAALLSMTEVGLGSFLHAWRLPLSGHFLSLNQGFISSRSVQASPSQSPWLPLQIAMIAAMMKSLSPAGKRLTPMLAISAQGFLFTLGQIFFGSNLIGHMVSMLLLSLWAFAQPVLLYLLVFGKSIIDVGNYFFNKLQEIVPITYDHLIYGIVFLISIKAILAVLVATLSLRKTEDQCDPYFQKLIKGFKKMQPKPVQRELSFFEKLKVVFKDLLQPWFVISILLMFTFFYLTNPNGVGLVWWLLRPIACGFVVFYVLRFFPVEKWSNRVLGNSDSNFRKAFERSLAYMRGDR